MPLKKPILTKIARRWKQDKKPRNSLFITPARMREIRWEESLVHARKKREKLDGYIKHDSGCRCGFIGCLAVPYLYSSKPEPTFEPAPRKKRKKNRFIMVNGKAKYLDKV